jgi:ribA/ribD-fused uncharacterized protein
MAYIKNWFSNMHPLDKPFKYQEMWFDTVEHFYQAMKAEKSDIETRRWIAGQTNGYAAKKAGRRVKIRTDWEDIKLAVMEYALRIKFAAGTSWHKRLMETEGEIVEWNNWGDRYWGKTLDGVGENHLGKLLMKLRDEMK